jgi:capsular exopolysaccharide synthesis family protein
MLRSEIPRFIAEQELPIPIPPAELITRAWTFLRRNTGTIVTCLLLTLAASVAYLLTATPLFTAEAALYLEPPKVQVTQTEQPVASSIDSTTIESQVEILQSDAIASAAIARLRLAEDPEFLAGHPGFLGSALNFLRTVFFPDNELAMSPTQKAMRILEHNLGVTRSGLSAVIRVSYLDSDPARAAKIANAVADTYVDSLVDARRNAAERASAWLRADLKGLQEKAAAAEKDVQEFRAKNDAGAQAKLNDLQATANTYRKLYESSLQRYAETVQQESLQLTEARVFSPALLPPLKGRPKAILILPLGVVLGLFLGLGLALWRELRDQSLRTPEQVREDLKTDCLAVVESIRTTYSRRARAKAGSVRPRTPKYVARERLFSHVLASPASQFAESIRGLKVNCDLQMAQSESKIIGLTSTLEGEGKSTIAANLARLLSRAGRPTLLVDADFHTMALSHVLAPDANVGFCEVALGSASLEDAFVCWDADSNLHFLPAVAQPQPFEASEFLGSGASREFLQRMREFYDYVVLDLPPLAPVVDARAASALVDGFMLVVQWGRTPIPIVRRTLRSAQAVQDQLLGTVLNNVNLRAMRLYGHGPQEESEFYGSRSSLT